MKLKAKVLFVLSLLLLMFGCKDKPRNVVKVETEDVRLSIPATRLDRGMFEKAGSIDAFNAWHKDQLATNPFYKTYLAYIMQLAPDSTSVVNLYRFTANRDFRDLQKAIDSTFSDIKPYHEKIEEAFKRYKVLFPRKTTPSVYYFNSGFNVGIWPDTNLIGIGLEWYIGGNHRIVQSLPVQVFPKYKRDNMQPYYLVSDAVRGWLLVNFYEDRYKKNLLEYIVFNGKVIYAADAGLAETPDTVLMNYSSAQMAWCYEHEENIWKQMVKQELLFGTSERELVRFTGDAPFTNGFPQGSAPRLGIFIGWQMVADYMEKYPDTPLDKLMREVKAEDILKAYKPR